MDFTLNDEQRMFAETARTLLANSCGPEQWRQQMASGAARDAARWGQIVATGLTPGFCCPKERVASV